MYRTFKKKTASSRLAAVGVIGAAGLAACANGEWNPEEFADKRSEAVRSEDMVIGRGYVQSTDDVAGDCVRMPDGSAAGEITSGTAQGQTVSFSLRRIDSSRQLAYAMSVKASATASFLGIGAEGAAEYVDGLEIKETSVVFMAAADVTNAGYTTNPLVQLSPAAANLLTPIGGQSTAERQARFKELCGDRFISSYTLGGRFYGLIVVQAKSVAEAELVKARMGGSFLSFSASGEFEQKVSEITSGAQTYISTYQEGGSGTNANPVTTVEGMVNRIENFASAVLSAPIKYEFGTRAYTTLPLPTDGVSPAVYDVNLSIMTEIQSAFYDASDYLKSVRRIEQNPGSYALGSFNISQAKSQATTAVNQYRGALVACSTNIASCQMPNVAALPALPAFLDGPRFSAGTGKFLVSNYFAPSTFMGIGTYSPVANVSCTSSVKAQLQSTTQRAAAVFELVTPLVPDLATGQIRYSLKKDGNWIRGVQVPYSTPCSSGLYVQSSMPTGTSTTELSTYEITPALNGKSGYYSIRGIQSSQTCGTGGPCTLSSNSRYLVSSSSDTRVVFAGIPANPNQEWKDRASWLFTEVDP